MDLRNKFIGKLRQVEDRIEALEMVLKRGRGDVRSTYACEKSNLFSFSNYYQCYCHIFSIRAL